MPPLLQLQKLPGKWDGGWRKKKVSLHCFLADKKIASSSNKMCFGARETSHCLLPDTF